MNTHKTSATSASNGDAMAMEWAADNENSDTIQRILEYQSAFWDEIVEFYLMPEFSRWMEDHTPEQWAEVWRYESLRFYLESRVEDFFASNGHEPWHVSYRELDETEQKEVHKKLVGNFLISEAVQQRLGQENLKEKTTKLEDTVKDIRKQKDKLKLNTMYLWLMLILAALSFSMAYLLQ